MRIRRTGRLARLVLASTCAAATLLAGPLAGVASADTQPIVDPAQWASFLGDHPELTAGTGGSTAVAACEAAVTCPAGLAIGAFAGSFYGTTKLLHWAFGSPGDDRSGVTDPNNYLTHAPTPGDGGGYFAFHCGSACTEHVQCTDLTSGATSLHEETLSSGSWETANYSCAFGPMTPLLADGIFTRFWTTEGATTVIDWRASPAAPWTVTAHVQCREADGTIVTVDGSPSSIGTPAPNQTVDTPLPSCPAGTDPVLGYVTGGRTASDPSGQVVGAMPTPQPSSTTSSTDNPDGSTSTVTTGDNPSTGDGPSDGCMGAVWSYNPVNWVFVPIKCALLWAFVPSDTQLQEDTATVTDAYNGSAIATLVGAVSDFGGALAPGSDSGSCDGPGLSIPPLGLSDFHPLSACSEPMATVAGYVKIAVSVGIVVGLVFWLLRVLGGSVGLQTPSGGDS